MIRFDFRLVSSKTLNLDSFHAATQSWLSKFGSVQDIIEI